MENLQDIAETKTNIEISLINSNATWDDFDKEIQLQLDEQAKNYVSETITESPNINTESPNINTESPNINTESPNINTESPNINTESYLYEKIIDFISNQKAAPVQKSAEWYKIKKNTIGGSEVATVLGLNPFKTLRSLVAEKTGIINSKFNGNLYTRWGNIFENVTKKWAEEILLMSTEIYESGSLEGILERQRYSPDGLGIVKLNNEYLIVLFEFKAPFKSIPDGKIPKYYRPQIQTGLLSIPIAATSIFINNCYRKCSLKDIGFSHAYNQEFHDDKFKISNVYACGVIYFYQTKSAHDMLKNDDNDINTLIDNEEYLTCNKYVDSSYDTDILINTKEQLIDFGEDNKYISRLFELYEEKKVYCKYSPLIINNKDIKNIPFLNEYNKLEREELKSTPKKIIKEFHHHFMEECEKEKIIPIGYLPWKLIKTDIIKDDRIDNWYEKIAEPINTTINNMDIISKASDPEKKYNELYPKKKRKTNNSESETEIEKIEMDINDMLNSVII
jgi:hypothetical protein